MVWDDDWKKEMDLRSMLDVEVIDLDVRCEVPAIKNRFLAWASDQLYNWVDGGFFTSRAKEEQAGKGKRQSGVKMLGVTCLGNIQRCEETD